MRRNVQYDAKLVKIAAVRKVLKSLGEGTYRIEPRRTNELDDKEELAALGDNIKQVYYQDYKFA